MRISVLDTKESSNVHEHITEAVIRWAKKKRKKVEKIKFVEKSSQFWVEYVLNNSEIEFIAWCLPVSVYQIITNQLIANYPTKNKKEKQPKRTIDRNQIKPKILVNAMREYF